MVRVLRTIPGVDHAGFGVASDHRAYVEYRAKAVEGFRPLIRFVAMNASRFALHPIYFQTVLGGLSDPDKVPPDFGANAIAKQWKEKCGIDASVDFV